MQFRIPFDLPIAKKRVHYSELTNSHYFCALKCTSTGDDDLINNFFEDLVTELTGIASAELFAADKFCLLLDIRSIALGDQIELKTNTNSLVKINISSIINNITNTLQHQSLMDIIHLDDVDIAVAPPKTLRLRHVDDLIYTSIHSLHVDGKEHLFHNFSSAEQEAMLNSLPVDVYNTITSNITRNQTTMRDACIIRQNSTIGIDGVPFSLYDNTMYDFLKAIYAGDLMNFYENQFNLLSKMHIEYDHFMKMTPNESIVFVNLYNKDVKKQNDSMNKTNNHASGIGGV